MIKINKEIIINANREKVWEMMLDKESYKVWTVPFCVGSYYEGELVEGGSIRFMGPHPETGKIGGIISVVEKIDKPSFISFKHLGYINDGLEDYESEEVKKWCPAYENYTFEMINEGETRVIVDVDASDEYADFMTDAWDKALAVLKSECEK